MQRQLSSQEAKVWELHMSGMTISDIAAVTRLDQGFVRSTICGIWRDDCQVIRNAA